MKTKLTIEYFDGSSITWRGKWNKFMADEMINSVKNKLVKTVWYQDYPLKKHGINVMKGEKQ